MPVDNWNCLAHCLPFSLSRRDKNSLPLVNDDSASGANTLQRPSLTPTQCDIERLSYNVNLAVVESAKSTVETELAAICLEQTASHTRDTSLVQQTTPTSHDATPVWNSVETATRNSGSSVVEEPKVLTSDEEESQEDYIALDQCQSGSGQQQRRNELSIQVSSLVNDSIAAPSPRSAATSSCSGDSFLLDVVPPSPCRGPVPLKSAVEYVPRYAAAAQCNALQSPDHSSGSLGRKVYPPPLSPPARACAEPRSSSPVIADRRTVLSSHTSPPTRLRVSTAVGGAAVDLGNFRHFDGIPSNGMQHSHHYHHQHQQHLPPRVLTPSHFSSELGLSASPKTATQGHQYYYYTNGGPESSAGGAVNHGFVSSTTSVPRCGDDNSNDDDDERNPEFAFLRSQAPPIPIKERRTVGSRSTNTSIEYSNSPGTCSPVCRPNYSNLDDQLDAVYVSEDRMHNPHRKTSAPSWSHSDAAAASNALENYENMTSSTAATAANDVSRTSATARLMSSSPNLSQSASELHMTPPAPHLPMSQVRVHRYVNAAAVQVDPAGNQSTRNVPEVLPPKMTTSPLSNARAIHARQMDERNKNTWTLPGHTAQQWLSGSSGSEYTDMKKYSRHRSAVETCYNVNTAKRRAQTLGQTASLDISLPTRKKIGFDGSGSSTDDDDYDMHSVASEFSSGTADSTNLDRPAALTLPPRSRRIPVPAESEGDVNYAVLALLNESNVEDHQPRSRPEMRSAVPAHHCTSGNRNYWNGAPRTPILSTNSGSAISARSDSDDNTTVYNVIDWEKTEAFNNIRRELENNRHCSSVISSHSGGASTGGTYVGAR